MMVVVLATFTAGWIPFLEPLDVDGRWQWPFLLIPLALAIAIVFKTLKIDDLRRLPKAAGWMAVQIVLFMMASALVLWGLMDVW